MVGAASSRQVLIFADKHGKEPFTDWLKSLKDDRHRRRILSRLRRLEQGNFGDSKHIQDGVFELRLFFGPGFRIYYGKDGDAIVILLCAGDKHSQGRDIKTALAYWKEYDLL